MSYRSVAPEGELGELRKKLADSEKEREKLSARLRYVTNEDRATTKTMFLISFIVTASIVVCVATIRVVWLWSDNKWPGKCVPVVVTDDPAAIKQR